MFGYYRKLIALRKEWDVISEGSYTPLLEEHPDLFAYRREYEGATLTVICSFARHEVPFPGEILPENSRLLLGNYEEIPSPLTMELRPFETRVFVH